MKLADCIERLLKLRRSRGIAPHQPCLLLAIVDVAEAGGFNDSNSIDIDDLVLVDSFHRYFDTVTNNGDQFIPDRAKPLVALIKNSFLHCEVNEQFQVEVRKYFKKVNPNLSQIRRTLKQTNIDIHLLKWLLDEEGRFQIRDALIRRYFPTQIADLWRIIDHGQQVTQYAERIRGWESGSRTRIPSDSIRDPAFRRVILEIYDSQCAASHQTIVLSGIALIDAAHLIPFNESQDDDPRNGLALTPTYHRALDKHLIAPGTDNKWKISKVLKQALREEGNRELGLFRNLEGRPVLPPIRKYKHLSPRRDALEWRLDHLLKS